ncbi:hypothetical protein NL676_000809 [Syzygium grande]|nr:hypothetical protein NL676_000809 [Syzygium grande]
MLLLAFGAALLGVMALHKLRERRISNLLLKDKDRELFSLHLLLQRERDRRKEMKRKFEGMKEKMYVFRTQKMELDSAVLETQSTVGSLKDEMRAMESAVQEKDNELKMLHEKIMEASRKDPEEVPLREILKLKEAEIEDLKQRLEKQVNVGSASSDDLSSLPRNSSMQGGEVQKDEASNVGVEGKGEPARESNRTSLIESKNEVLDGEVASRSDEGSEDKLGSADKMEVTEMEKLQGKGDSSGEHQEQGQVASEGNGIEDGRVNIYGLQEERKSDTGDGVSRNRNENGNAETINVKESLEENGGGKGGLKLETSENVHSNELNSVVVREEQERKEGRDQVEIKSVAADSNEDRVNGGEESDKSHGNRDKSIESENSEDKGDVEESAMNGGEKGPLKDEQEEMKSGNLSTNGEVLTNSASQGKANNIINEDGEREANVEIRRQEGQGANEDRARQDFSRETDGSSSENKDDHKA